MRRDAIIEALRPLAVGADGLELLLLVGSFARGEEHLRSDVDLAYLAGATPGR